MHHGRLLSFGAAESVARAANWITLALLPLFLSADEYGTVGLIVSAEALLLTWVMIGQDRAILRFRAVEPENDIFGASFVAPAIVFGLTAVVLIGVGVVSGDLFGIPVRPHLWLLVVATLLLGINKLRLARARSDGDLRQFLVLRTAVAVSKLTLTLVFVVFMPVSASYLWALVISLAVCMAIASLNTSKRTWTHRPDSRLVRRLLVFGWPFILHAVSGNVLVAADRFMLEHWVSAAAVGQYTLAYTVGFSTLFVFGAVAMYMEPQIYSRSGDRVAAEALIGHYSYICLFFALVVGAVAIVSFDTLAPRVLGAEYADASPLVPLVVAAYLLHPAYNQGNYRLTIAQRTGVVAAASGFAAVSNVVLNIVLIPRWGAMGAAIATLISYAILALGTLGVSLYLTEARWSDVRVRAPLVGSFLLALSIPLLAQVLSAALVLIAAAVGILLLDLPRSARYAKQARQLF